jgi:ferredoxin
MAAARVLVDKSKCCGAGQCVVFAPAVFDQQEDDGTVVLLDERPPGELMPAVRTACSRCPSRAIRVENN